MTVEISRPVTLALVEDHRPTREGLRQLIEGTPGYRCLAAFASIEEARRLPAEAPDVILLDIGLPGVSGTDGLASLHARWPEARVVMLTAFEDEDKVFAALCGGASGYVLKRTPPARLLEAIREAHEGGAPMSPEIARKVVALLQRIGPPARLEAELNVQEQKLLALLAEGASYQTAADRLRVSINTVRGYIRSIYEKLHVHSKSAAVSKALKAGLL